MFKFDESMIGKKVRFINAKAHEDEPWFYPEVGTIGTIIWTFDEIFDEWAWKVRWPDGTTESCGIPNDCWYCGEESIELAEEEEEENI